MPNGMRVARNTSGMLLQSRSPTVGINVVHRTELDGTNPSTVINVFVDGRAESSHGMPGHISLAEAFIWYGTQRKLLGES